MCMQWSGDLDLLSRKCPSCEKAILPNARRCPSCGADLADEALQAEPPS